jgi:uncharacterized membrane protein YhaH (DUF805 family)
MDMSMFTGFEGRINRAKWWLGAIILIVIGIIIGWIVSSIVGVSMWGGGMTTAPDGTVTFDTAVLRQIAIAQLITFIILVYPWLAITTKRINDRDRPRYFAYIFLLPSVLSILAGLLGLSATAGIAWIISLASIAIGIWALIELGILKGTTGPNQHGPDPLGT